MEQQNVGKTTLGARMRAIEVKAKAEPLLAGREKAEKLGGEALAYYNAVEKFFERAKACIETAIANGEYPKPIELTDMEAGAIGAHRWDQHNPVADPRNDRYALVQQFTEWARAEEIQWKWKYCFDNGGIHSWWRLVVLSPAEVEKQNRRTK